MWKEPANAPVTVNNLAISLAQQPVSKATIPAGADASGVAPPTRAALLASARSWALQAHKTGKAVKEDEGRTAECDEACAVALHNLGEIAAMGGDMEEAVRWFKESKVLSTQIGFKEGVKQAQDGLRAAAYAGEEKKAKP